MEVAGQRVTVMGLGRHGGGVGVARWLAGQGAIVTATDLADEAALADSLAELAGSPVARYRLGGHCEQDFLGADLVVVNPAVRPGDRWVRLAESSGARISSEIEIFMQSCPGRMVGVTGSNGKSTTAAMIAEILRADGRRVWLGGNIGGSLLGDLAAITRDDWAVLELSSFQLHWLSPGARFPEAAVATNCTSNHLDWHGSWADYVAAKQRLFAGRSAAGLAVLNDLDPETARWAPLLEGRRLKPWPVRRIGELALPGAHNRTNAACAAALAAGLGCSHRAIEQGLADFRGLPHRLELVAEAGGRKFYNDSMATTPESAIAAIDALGPRAWFLVGGYDKGLDYRALVERLSSGARGAAFYGAARDTLNKLASLASRSPGSCEHRSFESLVEAAEWSWRRSQPGEAIVLSPACASYDQFRDYRHRAATFVEIARSIAARNNR
jgi:UDP-N-acetylmuramoylalanine--D-glutamate ligase